jgi:hypothetical protein
MGTALVTAAVGLLLIALIAAIVAVQKRKEKKLAAQLLEFAQRVSTTAARLEAAETALAFMTTQAFRTPEPAVWQKAIALLAERPNMTVAEVAEQLGVSIKTLQAEPAVQAAKRRAMWGYSS